MLCPAWGCSSSERSGYNMCMYIYIYTYDNYVCIYICNHDYLPAVYPILWTFKSYSYNHMYTHTHTYIYIYIYPYICIYIYIHTYTYAYAYSCKNHTGPAAPSVAVLVCLRRGLTFYDVVLVSASHQHHQTTVPRGGITDGRYVELMSMTSIPIHAPQFSPFGDMVPKMDRFTTWCIGYI